MPKSNQIRGFYYHEVTNVTQTLHRRNIVAIKHLVYWNKQVAHNSDRIYDPNYALFAEAVSNNYT